MSLLELEDLVGSRVELRGRSALVTCFSEDTQQHCLEFDGGESVWAVLSQEEWKSESPSSASGGAEATTPAAATSTTPAGGANKSPFKRPRGKPPAGHEWDAAQGQYVPIQLSDFEVQRLKNIEENAKRLRELGLMVEPAATAPASACAKRARKVYEHDCTFQMRERTVRSYTEPTVHGEDFRDAARKRKAERKERERAEREELRQAHEVERAARMEQKAAREAEAEAHRSAKEAQRAARAAEAAHKVEARLAKRAAKEALQEHLAQEKLQKEAVRALAKAQRDAAEAESRDRAGLARLAREEMLAQTKADHEARAAARLLERQVAQANKEQEQLLKEAAREAAREAASEAREIKEIMRVAAPGGEKAARCGNCPGCLAPNCGRCAFCRDMVKFGGKGTMRKACRQRDCELHHVGNELLDTLVSSGAMAVVDATAGEAEVAVGAEAEGGSGAEVVDAAGIEARADSENPGVGTHPSRRSSRAEARVPAVAPKAARLQVGARVSSLFLVGKKEKSFRGRVIKVHWTPDLTRPDPT